MPQRNVMWDKLRLRLRLRLRPIRRKEGNRIDLEVDRGMDGA
jgi:hypothetical protein